MVWFPAWPNSYSWECLLAYKLSDLLKICWQLMSIFACKLVKELDFNSARSSDELLSQNICGWPCISLLAASGIDCYVEIACWTRIGPNFVIICFLCFEVGCLIFICRHVCVYAPNIFNDKSRLTIYMILILTFFGQILRS